jgi:hypothetical protein
VLLRFSTPIRRSFNFGRKTHLLTPSREREGDDIYLFLDEKRRRGFDRGDTPALFSRQLSRQLR